MELPSDLDFDAYSSNADGGLLQEKEVDITIHVMHKSACVNYLFHDTFYYEW